MRLWDKVKLDQNCELHSVCEITGAVLRWISAAYFTDSGLLKWSLLFSGSWALSSELRTPDWSCEKWVLSSCISIAWNWTWVRTNYKGDFLKFKEQKNEQLSLFDHWRTYLTKTWVSWFLCVLCEIDALHSLRTRRTIHCTFIQLSL